ncbi:MAG: DNA polymerase ligase N-terminal domain-containing protein, partial [Petrimonas sp.]|nr:DNA polymerase ligase N-terminal domain-containing protein [Petrimonas sp.]
MSLDTYKKKRDFTRTSEPEEGDSGSGNRLLFVIQRHAARRLHYDFRLEMEGVLKSWAVPKGPSLNPADKRLAMMVEDHPFSYRTFEGTIPEGSYGAGEVEIWDEGFYEPLNHEKGKTDNETLLKELKNGSIKIILHGKKLNGEFALVKMHGAKDENAWLLIKHNDRYAVHDAYDAEKETSSASKVTKLAEKKYRDFEKPAKDTSKKPYSISYLSG